MSQQTPERRFDIVFTGEPLNGTDVADVKENLRQLFKLGEADLEKMFSGQPISIKKDLDRKTASQYQQALTRAGAKIQLVLHQPAASEAPGPTVEPAPEAHNAGESGLSILPAGSRLAPERTDEAAAIAVDTSHLSVEDASEDAAAPAGRASYAVSDPFAESADTANGPRYPAAEHIELDTALTLAEVGTLLERAAALPPLNVETGHLSIAELGVLLGEGATSEIAAPQISGSFSLAEAGSDLLEAHEKRMEEPVEVDTSALSISDN